MTKSTQELEMSSRVRELLRAEFDHSGRFTLLEKLSGVGASKWKNFFYERQSANSEMVEFLCKKFPDRAGWIKSGDGGQAETTEALFQAKPPGKRDGDNVRTRLKWVIREWAAPRGARLFRYLADRTNEEISETEWESFFVDDTPPSAEMIAAGCEERRLYTEWVVHGNVSKPFREFGDQLDPTDPAAARNLKRARTAWQTGHADSAEQSSGPAAGEQPLEPDQARD